MSQLLALASKPSRLGAALRSLPEWLLREAERRAKQDAESQKRNEDPDRLPVPNPWQFLIEARCVPQKQRNVFRAAQSQIYALRHLIHACFGFATLNRDWHREAIVAAKGKDARKFQHAVSKLAQSLLAYALVRESVTREGDAVLAAQMNAVLELRRKRLIREGQRGDVAAKQWPDWKSFCALNKVPVALFENWAALRLQGRHLPGLMFWRNEAIAEFLQVWLDQRLSPQSVKKVRQRLGLVPAENRAHFVWLLKAKSLASGGHDLVASKRDGSEIFRIENLKTHHNSRKSCPRTQNRTEVVSLRARIRNDTKRQNRDT